jgi:Flp pilus assembly protein TadD
MSKSNKLTWAMGWTAAALAVVVVGWAVVRPLVHQRKALQHLAAAHRYMAPPLTPEAIDPDEVDCARAEQELTAALALKSRVGQAYRELPLAQGCAALHRGDFILAEGALNTALQRLPGDARTFRWLGALALRQENATKAVAHYEHALDLDGRSLPVRLGLADALAAAGQPRRALALLDEGPSSPLAVVALRRGLLLAQMGRSKEARQAYQEAVALAPERPEPLNNLAILEEDEGHRDQAWQYQQRALTLMPHDPVMLFNTGLLAIRIGYDNEAFHLLRRAAELDLESPDPARALADHRLVTGQPQKALEVLGPAVDRFAEDAALRNSLGNALSALGRRSEARDAYRRAIELAPHLAEPHNGLAVLSLAAGNLDQAEAELDRALRLSPNHRDARRNLAELRRRRRLLP